MRDLANKWAKPALPFAVFLLAYLGYATIQLLVGASDSTSAQLAPAALLGIMIFAIIWHGRQQDEVHRAIARRADAVGFWGTFLVLYVVSTVDSFSPVLERVLPLWAVPLSVWLVGYLWTLVRYR